MAKKKFYGIMLTNGTKDVLENWDDAKALIATCPSGAKYKGFGLKQDALAFIGAVEKDSQTEMLESIQTDAIAFTDGSFNNTLGIWGAAAILQDNRTKETKIIKLSGTEHAEHRNATGEAIAAIEAAKNAIKLGYKSLTIVHDYMGVSEWATGAWKRNNEMSTHYHRAMDQLMQMIDIRFIHVDGHSGVAGNESVDKYAKQACGL